MKIREMTLDGLERVSRGGTGECWRIDDETLLKLYYEGMPEEWAIREKECARTAFTIGVPTAISFEVVRVGNRLGVIYETLKGKTLSQQMKEHPEEIPEIGKKYADLAKTLHTVKGDSSRFGRSTDVIRKELPKIDFAPEKTVGRIGGFLDELDTYTQYVHGDFHPNNVMVCGDELMLIDLGGFSVGCPLFDIATTRFCMLDSPEAVSGGISSFTGLSHEQHVLFWNAFTAAYFEGETGEDQLVKDVELLKRLRFERLYRYRFPDFETYFQNIRDEVLERWGN